MQNKQIHIISGGSLTYVRSHFALCAPAYGTTGHALMSLLMKAAPNMDFFLHLTRMAGGREDLETNDDVERLVKTLVADPLTKIIFMPVALSDFVGRVYDDADPVSESGKQSPRLQSRKHPLRTMMLQPAKKIIVGIREHRKDIFLVGWKETFNFSENDQYRAALGLCKEASCNLVFANDTGTRLNMVITPEEARYHVSQDRQEVLRGLVEMTLLRSNLTFTRSTVVAGEPVPWNSKLVPQSLRQVVDHCIRRGAYKPFRGATAGHFAVKIDNKTFLTSRRKTDFNKLGEIGLVKIETDGPDSVIAYGSKPSVGGQSQRIVFHDHAEYDCILHFHCPRKAGSDVPCVSQRAYECGSHECGENTSFGLRKFGDLSAVYLENHGPNIVFHRSINPDAVIAFVEDNFDLDKKTGGLVEK